MLAFTSDQLLHRLGRPVLDTQLVLRSLLFLGTIDRMPQAVAIGDLHSDTCSSQRLNSTTALLLDQPPCFDRPDGLPLVFPRPPS